MTYRFEIQEKDKDNQAFFHSQGKIDFEDIPNSQFPQELHMLNHEDWERINAGEKITKTRTITTVITVTLQNDPKA